ncbi:hypothetical protein [Arthrobacter sp. KNU40]
MTATVVRLHVNDDLASAKHGIKECLSAADSSDALLSVLRAHGVAK